MATAVANPFDFYTDRKGDALDEGYIYVGVANQDPQLFPQAVFFDEALTIPATQPLRSIAGYVVNPGAGNSQADVYVAAAYSIRVRDKQGNQVLYSAEETDPLSEFIAELGGPNGGDLVGGITDPSIPYPVVLRTIMLDYQTSRFLSGTGDGDPSPAARSAETAKFQATIDQGRSFSVPEPSVTYAVNSLVLAQGQTIEGCGQFDGPLAASGGKFQFTGNGVDPVFICGDGSGSKRMMTLRDLSAFNSAGKCVYANNAPNFIAERVRLRSEGGAHALDMLMSYRSAIRDSMITASGGGTAIHAMNNINGLTIENVTCTGGSGGRAIQIGQSQALRIVSNIIESSRDGIWIGSTSDTGDGNCNGVMIAANYFEQVGTPLVIAKVYSAIGMECVSNFISNTSASVITYRQAQIQFGRIRGGLIADNAMLPVNAGAYPSADPEDLFWIWLETAGTDWDRLSVVRNRAEGPGTAANIFQFKGTNAANASVLSAVGGVCNFGFMGSGNPLGADQPRIWQSGVLDTSATVGRYVWLPDDMMSMGGRITGVWISDWDGNSLAGAALQIGTPTADTANVSVVDLSTLTFTSGYSQVPVTVSALFDAVNRTYRVAKLGASTGKFRLNIAYRAN